MLQQILNLLSAVLTAVIVSKAFAFFTSLAAARRFAVGSPIPFVTIPWYRESGWFWLLSPWLAPYLEKLPFRLGHWVRYKKRDFSWAHKGRLPREELKSDVFWTAAVEGCLLHVSDADVVTQIVHRWKDFPKSEFYYNDLTWFGENVITTEGSDWQRIVKLLALRLMNEIVSNLVFQESLSQAKAMLASFTHKGDGTPSTPGTEPVVKDLVFWMKVIALNVLSGAAFNRHISWPMNSIGSSDANHAGELIDGSSDPGTIDPCVHLLSWQHCMNAIMEHFYFLIGLSQWQLEHAPWKFLRDLPAAYIEFMDYIQEMIDDASGDNDDDDDDDDDDETEDKIPTHSDDSTSTNPLLRRNDLLSNILRANANDQLDDSEITGNICILLIAGHETSASLLETALILLATEPDFQQTIQDEIDTIWAGKKAGEDLTYADYPKMATIMALMLETLRLYPPIINLFKTTYTPQVLTYRSQPLPIPADTTIFLEAVSLHRNPLYWSPNPDSFHPRRWLKPPSYSPPPGTLSESPAHANLLCPQKGSFIPFGAGMRSCLGKKFAQVEFCTIVAVLLRECSIELVDDGDGKGWEEKRREALECLDRRGTIIALRMLGKVKVRFVRRGYESFPVRNGKMTS